MLGVFKRSDHRPHQRHDPADRESGTGKSLSRRRSLNSLRRDGRGVAPAARCRTSRSGCSDMRGSFATPTPTKVLEVAEHGTIFLAKSAR
jgi:hypothetical protein